MMCEVCRNAKATHFCTGCRKWLCDGFMCNLKSATVATVRHPIDSARIATHLALQFAKERRF